MFIVTNIFTECRTHVATPLGVMTEILMCESSTVDINTVHPGTN